MGYWAPSARKAYSERTRSRDRDRRYQRQYGITLKDYEAMEESQHGRCALCFKTSEQVLDVDHCHTTHVVRGLLCRGCNIMLGCVGDSVETLERAIAYLQIASSRN